MKKLKPESVHLVLGDFHVPYHDPAALEIVYDVADRLQPDVLHLLGDVVDFYMLSDHQRDPEKRFSLQYDLDETAKVLRGFRNRLPHATIVYHEGNHEDRLRRYLLREADELAILRDLRFHKLMRLADLDILWRPVTQPWRHGGRHGLIFTHGTLIRSRSAYTAKAMLERWGSSVIHGHTHREGCHFRTTWNGTMGAWENACLCDLNPTAFNAYTKGVQDWQQGFSIVTFWRCSDQRRFSVEQVHMQGGTGNKTLCVRGQPWSP